MCEKKTKLLIVDDDDVYCSVLKDAFKQRGFDVQTAQDGESAQTLIQHEAVDLAVIDLRLGQTTGLSLIKQVKERNGSAKIVMLTGYASIATAVEAVKLGATQYLTKPVNVDEIIHAFEMDVADLTLQPAEQPMSVKRLEWEYMQKVLLACDGNISQAARQLGLHRRTLQRKLFKHPVKK